MYTIKHDFLMKSFLILSLVAVSSVCLISMTSMTRRITVIFLLHVPKSLPRDSFNQLKNEIIREQINYTMNLSSNNLYVCIFRCDERLNPIIRLSPVESIEQLDRELETSLNKSDTDSGNLASCLNDMNSIFRAIGLQNNDDNLVVSLLFPSVPFPLQDWSDFKSGLRMLEEISLVNVSYIGDRHDMNFNWYEHLFGLINRRIVDFGRIDEVKKNIRFSYNKGLKKKRFFNFNDNFSDLSLFF